MAAILISVNDIKYLKTWLAINEESIYNWTAFRNAFFLVSTYASAPIPTKQRPYAFWGLPALAFALHGWQRRIYCTYGLQDLGFKP